MVREDASCMKGLKGGQWVGETSDLLGSSDGCELSLCEVKGGFGDRGGRRAEEELGGDFHIEIGYK